MIKTDAARSPDAVDIAVGEAVRDARQMRGETQSTLARGIGVTFQQVQKYERGANRISASMLTRIANHLNVAVTSLFPRDSLKLPPDTPALMTLEGGEELSNLYSALPATDRAAVLQMAKALYSARTGD